MLSNKSILEVINLKKFFPMRSPFGRILFEVKAVNGVSFILKNGETLGLVGESGCGKTTVARTILRLTEPTDGKAYYKGKNLFSLKSKQFRKVRQDIQIVFQDPYSSLNPRKRVGTILEEPMIIHGIGSKKERTEIVLDLISQVGLQPEHYYRFPHEFSGGQRQRIGLARALATNPKVVICDEPVSALDVSIQSQIINLLQNLQNDFKLSYLFISHDLSVVRYVSDRIGVMYLSKIVELATNEALFDSPLHPYTKSLLSAIPIPKPGFKKEQILLKGEIPSPLNVPSGCYFHPRCPNMMDICKAEIPQEKEVYTNHFVSCHLYS